MDYNNNGSDPRNDFSMQSGGYPPYPQQYPPGNSQVVLREVGQQRENRMAVTALVLGIVTLIFFWIPFISMITGIAGMVIAVISLIKEDSRVMPITGMVLSIIGLALGSLVILGFIAEYLMGITSY